MPDELKPSPEAVRVNRLHEVLMIELAYCRHVELTVSETASRIEAILSRRHVFWGPNEQGCPPEIKARNGELTALRCKVCGQEGMTTNYCFEAAALVVDRALRPATMPGDVVQAARAMWPLINSDLTFEEAAAIKDDAGYAWVMDLATAALTAMQPALQAAVDALEGALPFLEDAETKRLVGDEGCVWAVENVRHSLATLRTVTEQGEG